MQAATGNTLSILDHTVGAAAPAGALAALLRALGQRRAAARAIDSLNRLDDRALKDIGVHRTEISSLVHHDQGDPSRRPR